MIGKIIISFIVAFLSAIIISPFLIRFIKKRYVGQQVREDGPSSHHTKAGTPTMGGIAILLAAVIAFIATTGVSVMLYLLLLITIGCGLIGFLDDFYKLRHGQSLGLKARSKLAGKLVLTLLFITLLKQFDLYSSELVIPFVNKEFDLGIIYPIFIFILITGFSNSVNLTDGLDGLAAGTALIALSALAVLALHQGFMEAALFSGALAGSCFGFLFYNRHPALLFMGDVGSLALGGAMAAVAVLTKTELFLIIIGAVFFIEALSVIGQVISFRLTGRRIFLMSPLHHHFELKGWSEWKVVSLFWIVALIFALAGVFAFSF